MRLLIFIICLFICNICYAEKTYKKLPDGKLEVTETTEKKQEYKLDELQRYREGLLTELADVDDLINRLQQ